MKAMVIDRYGGADELRLRDVPVPEMGETDVLIEVRAASVNPVDWKIREGYLKEMIPHRFPLILGWDAAGVVAAAGPRAGRFTVGDHVFACTDIRRNGCYAEYVSVDENLVSMKPHNLSFEEAASVPLAGQTAWQALMEHAAVAEGQRVLIHAGSGGVGSLAIQIAKSRGAYVVATCSTLHLSFVRELGADQVIDYTRSDFTETLSDFDVVLDSVGGETHRKSFQVLKPKGVLVSIVEHPDDELAQKTGVRAEYMFMQPEGKRLARLGQMLSDRVIRPMVTKTYPLNEVRKAHELSSSRHAEGKLVLQIRNHVT
ncbi:NADP-dependent oxidoreductase [Geobacter sp. DSM 9736]|uniref:NADP-dependent oxidoreductase n=1 Tax=Geobacter sp. DSM 9736 TaxID=1277350 RepID=UPI000B502A76|nr:NADP-dependent oxidoreductase [Geobacter sp. DSM 9736]SNB46693.1 NADPH:quinone reductase [Geobacter sp. DSM 9736]